MASHSDRVDILVVEDEPAALEGVVQILRMEGFRVVGARDGAEAIGLLEDGVSPSLVLLDLTMPVMDGWEFCSELETRDDLSEVREVPIAVFTGVEIDTVGELPDRRHDAGFIEKPVRIASLLELARRYCAVASD